MGHNFDDITDIASPPSWAFRQHSSRSFYMTDNMDDTPVPVGKQLTLYSYPNLAPIGSAQVSSYAVSGPCAALHHPCAL